MLRELRDLMLADNSLKRGIPSALGDLSQLEYLNLRDNEFTGTLPERLSDLSKLKSLYLYQNSSVCYDFQVYVHN